MPVLVGFHVEGSDALILRALLARLLGIPETEILPDALDDLGRGYQFVLNNLPKALSRFYSQCAQAAIVGIDNDGTVDIAARGLTEDPRHPRHANHPGTVQPGCRMCDLEALVAQTRSQLNYVPLKRGATWPVLLAVPVETVEAWLLIVQALVDPGQGSLHAEGWPRSALKQRLYGRPAATAEDVRDIALPLVRSLGPTQLAALATHSPSFAQFAAQVAAHKAAILGPRDCWQPGDRAAERPAIP